MERQVRLRKSNISKIQYQDETEDYTHQDAVLNLLGFRNISNSIFEVNQQALYVQEQHNSVSSENASIIDSFQPKFLIIFDKYADYCEVLVI